MEKGVLLKQVLPCGCVVAAMWQDDKTHDADLGAFYRQAGEYGCEIKTAERIGKGEWECDKGRDNCPHWQALKARLGS